MVFSSMIFLWIFLPIVLIAYWLLGERSVKAGNIILVIASLVFYAWGEPVYILLMLFSVLMNYLFARWIGAAGGGVRKLALFLSVVGNLSLLGFFKYYVMLADLANKLVPGILPEIIVALPLGISFYTFQAMSYVIDVYRGKAAVQKNFFKVLLYISLFPQLIAGPIVRYADIAAQIDSRVITDAKKQYGMKRFLYGLGKKVLLANFFGQYADRLFGMHVWQVSSGIEWLKVLFYALQIYYDFSGYSDMAIGLGAMFGFDFRENFNYPYISASIREHWRRWHMSLGTWFREYVYIPLGGNRRGQLRTCLNLLIVFFLTGLWHGASLRFVAWGLFYGVFIVIERLFLGKALDWLKAHKLGFINHVYYWAVMLTGWVFFRENGIRSSLQTIKAMFVYQSGSIGVSNCLNPAIITMLVIGVLGAGVVQAVFPKVRDWLYRKDKVSWPEFVWLMGILFASCIMLVSDQYNAFIYFRF